MFNPLSIIIIAIKELAYIAIEMLNIISANVFPIVDLFIFIFFITLDLFLFYNYIMNQFKVNDIIMLYK